MYYVQTRDVRHRQHSYIGSCLLSIVDAKTFHTTNVHTFGLISVYSVVRKGRAEVPNIAVRLVRHQQARRDRLPRPAQAAGNEDLHRTAVRNK